MSDGEELAVLQLQYGALLAPGGVQQPRWFQIDLPPSVLEAWSQSTDLEPQRHINKIEAIVLAICLCTWPNLIRGSLWLHFIDIDGALACLVSGSSKNSSLSAVVFILGRRLGCWPWFERVFSECNIVDGLSRRIVTRRSCLNLFQILCQLFVELAGRASPTLLQCRDFPMDTSSGLCHEKSVISVPVRVRVSNFRAFSIF